MFNGDQNPPQKVKNHKVGFARASPGFLMYVGISMFKTCEQYFYLMWHSQGNEGNSSLTFLTEQQAYVLFTPYTMASVSKSLVSMSCTITVSHQNQTYCKVNKILANRETTKRKTEEIIDTKHASKHY